MPLIQVARVFVALSIIYLMVMMTLIYARLGRILEELIRSKK